MLKAVRFAAPAASASLAFALCFVPPPAGKVEDLLAQQTGDYFERGGFCFAPKFVMAGGSCYLCIYFQNHFEGHATARIELSPPADLLGRPSPLLPAATVTVECPGGAFGVASMQTGFPMSEQGKRHAFRLAAGVDYPRGRGERLCAGEGAPVGPLPIGRGSSRAWILLPTGAPEVAPAKVEVEVTLLWGPDLPTGGFPVLPVKTAA